MTTKTKFGPELEPVYQALGGDHLATRIINALLRNGINPDPQSVCDHWSRILRLPHLGETAHRRMTDWVVAELD